jgi:hypothetical protein
MKTLVYWGISWCTSNLTTLDAGKWIFSGPGRLLLGTRWRAASTSLIFQLNEHYVIEYAYLIFLTDYASILLWDCCFVLFLGSSDLFSLFLCIKAAFVPFLFIWVRGNIFQFRYDKLSCLAWRRFLPLSLNYLLFFVGVRCFVFSLLQCVVGGV